MKYIGENMQNKPVIVIEEKPDFIPGQPEGETPVIIIEDDSGIGDNGKDNLNRPRRRLMWGLFCAFGSMLLCLILIGSYWLYRRYVNIGVPVSVTSEQNIAKLQKVQGEAKPEVVMTSDSILGVGFNMYELRGLRAEISFDEPDVTDSDVYLYSRCSDFTSYDPQENQYIGSLVMNGEELQSDNSRLGYCAMANDNIVIGVARDEDVKDYCIDQGGSFFRQFVLVSGGMLPPRFYLHGKVERRGIGRIGDKLYYIESHGKEGMYEFADALREYGFIDAIYITGGTDYCFYRTIDGKCHSIGDSTQYEKKHKGTGLVPWVVFKKR